MHILRRGEMTGKRKYELIEHTARWVADGGPLLGKPTKFERRDGRF